MFTIMQTFSAFFFFTFSTGGREILKAVSHVVQIGLKVIKSPFKFQHSVRSIFGNGGQFDFFKKKYICQSGGGRR